MENAIKNLILIIITFLMMSSLLGCSYYENQTRQANLDIELAKYRSTMQKSPSLKAPAQFVVCDLTIYPCSLVTPINLPVINDLNQPSKILDNQKQKKLHSKKGKHQRRHSKRTSPCKN